MDARITIRDVARVAGVSTTTVSDAVNETGRLSAATRHRVRAVATELGYAPSPVARGLRRGSTETIGFYAPYVRNRESPLSSMDYSMHAAAGAADRAFAEGLALSLLPTNPDPVRIRELPMAGVVVMDPGLDDPVIRAFAGRGPVVTCDRDLTPGARHQGVVDFDYSRGVREVLDHLAAAGAKRPALITTGAPTAWELDVRAAYERWVHRRGSSSRVAVAHLDESAGSTYAAAGRLLDAKVPADALLVMPEGGVAGVLSAAAERGRSVPGNLLVASCIDGPPCVQADPPITAIDLDGYEVGHAAAGLLADLLGGRAAEGTRIRLRAQTRYRRSTLR